MGSSPTLYFPAPAIANAMKTNINSIGCEALIIPSPFAKCEIETISIVKANTQAVGRVNKPRMIKAAPTLYAAIAANPQKEVIKVIPILCMAVPNFSQFSGSLTILGIP